jgi:hypothetical protein
MAQQEHPDNQTDHRRTHIGRKRPGGLVEHVVARTRTRAPIAPDTLVNKTYRIHANTVAEVAQAATDHHVGLGELVEWLIKEGLADLAAGRKQLPVVTVPAPTTPLGGKRRGRQPLERRIVVPEQE